MSASTTARTTSGFTPFILRDGAIAATSIALFVVALPILSGDGFAADFLGLFLGVGVAYALSLPHEWGHMLGARLSGATIHPKPSLKKLFAYDFDYTKSTNAQWIACSVSGFAGTGIALVLAYTLLPDGVFASRVARSLIGLLALLGLVAEVPLLIRVLRMGLPLTPEQAARLF